LLLRRQSEYARLNQKALFIGFCQVREAQRLGARAVVVGGDDPHISGLPDDLVIMYSKGSLFFSSSHRFSAEDVPGDASDIKIASTYIKYSDYTELCQLIKSSTTSHAGLQTLPLVIATEYSAWEWYS